MYKRMIAMAFASAMILGGCASTTTAVSSETTSSVSSATSSENSSSEISEKVDETLDFLTTATKDQYTGLEVTADLRNRMAILPGEIFQVAVTIKNTGDQTISYVNGAGTNSTPDALILQTPDLQPILPEDHLGISTMDFSTLLLEPGETLEFVLNVAAIKPQENFNEITYNLYSTEGGTYIGDLSAEELLAADPELVVASAGSYTGTVYFPYTVIEADGSTDPLNAPTGYAEATFAFTIS